MRAPGGDARAGGRFVVSLDFELHWGVRDTMTLERYEPNLRGARAVVPRMLELFARHEVSATWATVGLLFADGREEALAAAPAVRPRYRNPLLSPYAQLERCGSSEVADPLHFAPSLVELIAATPGQEVATHTFSHFYTLEPERDRDAFLADLDAAIALAGRRRLALTTIVFPRNQVPRDWLPECAERGITAYRGTERSWLYDPAPERTNAPLRRVGRLLDAYAGPAPARLSRPSARPAPVDVPSSRFLRPFAPRLRALEGLKLRRVTSAMTAAARTGATFHVWWHPHNFGRHPDESLAALAAILRHFDALRERHGMRSASMRDVAAECLAAPA